MYVMGEKVGHAVLPVERPQAGNWTQKVVKPVDAPLATKGKPQTHEVSIGENEEVYLSDINKILFLHIFTFSLYCYNVIMACF